jgi:nucleoid DNA-binding protein
MAKKNAGREEIYEIVKTSLGLKTKKDAERTTLAVVDAVSSLLTTNIGTDGYSVKVPVLGRFTVKHVAGKLRKNPFKSGQLIQTSDKRKIKFASLGEFRELEKVKK